MKRADLILCTHAGALPRSEALREKVFARSAGLGAEGLDELLAAEVKEVVARQHAIGIDSVNDGELGKTTFTSYVQERLSGFEVRKFGPNDPPPLFIASRDRELFPDYFRGGRGFGSFAGTGEGRPRMICTGPLTYVGHQALERDLANFTAALRGVDVADAFLPANTPGTIEHWLHDGYYGDTEKFLNAVGEAMRVEYKAIVDAGFTLQIDDPDLLDGWQMYPHMSVSEYLDYASLRVAALNHALRDIPRERIRLHVCWGSYHGPHVCDIPLREIVHLVFSVRAGAYSIEASNPRHEHEWTLFEDVKLPDGAMLIPGVVGHCTNFVEHPELVAQRLERYARLVGRENVMAGTDCGLGGRVANAEVAWAKLQALAEGARIASRRLWGRAAD